MIIEIGHFALILALATAVVQSVVPLVGARRRDAGMMAVGPLAAVTSLMLVAISFFALTHAYVVSDFSVQNVVENSHSLKPMLYKVTGVWGNHEGSMLLWVLILVLFSALVALFGRNLPDTLKANVLAVQAWITVAFLLFVVLTSNPFNRLDPAPLEGNDLNPILQDIGLAIHPPLLYLGYVGFSISFAFAIAALIEGRIDAAWARWVRPWTLTAWIFPDRRHLDGQLLGLLRARLGRLVVLGSGRERLLHAVAGWHRAASFRACHGKTRGVEDLDGAAGHPDILVLAAGYLPGALRGPDIGACLCHRSRARRVHSRNPRGLHRRGAGPLRPGGRVRSRPAACSRRSRARARSFSTTCS
jgi:hypothetical protein